ncbi:hypothetical protein [Azorhizobium sp. AG788]|uniref:hypothetical protein n=1 Tax=Azorhizobium sp. AG788 TaxID=2183897 RepID=UPI003138AE87
MTLPAVSGWIIDFRAANAIFLSGNNASVAHIVGKCQAGTIHICHCEEAQFKTAPLLKSLFSGKIFEPDDDIYERCDHVASLSNGKKFMPGAESAIFIPATAACKNFGVICDHRSPVFATAYDICVVLGVPVYSHLEYFAEL